LLQFQLIQYHHEMKNCEPQPNHFYL
jgi:hypothetical protein